MNIFAWLGRRIRLTDRSFWAAYYGGETWAGESVNPEIAMQISAFWGCVRLISQTIGTLPMAVYQSLDDGTRKLRKDHALYGLVHDRPNADHTAVEFWEGVAACMCLSGNAFAEKTYQGTGARRRLVAMTLLNPAFMMVTRQADGPAGSPKTMQMGCLRFLRRVPGTGHAAGAVIPRGRRGLRTFLAVFTASIAASACARTQSRTPSLALSQGDDGGRQWVR